MIVGIDFSINSPGLCVLTDDGRIEFATFARSDVAKPEFFKLLKAHNVHIHTRETIKQDENNLILNSRVDTQNAWNIATSIYNFLLRINNGRGNIDNNVLILEGFSYGSISKRLAQLSGYQFITRAILLYSPSNLFKTENLYVYAPQTVKSVAGASGRGENKSDMIQRFIEHNKMIKGLMRHPFYVEMCNDTNSVFRKEPTKRKEVGDWQKPIDDIVDSYWVLYTHLMKSETILELSHII